MQRIAAILLAVFVMAAADAPAPAPSATTESRAAAEELLRASGAENTATQVLTGMRNVLVTTLQQNGAKSPEDAAQIADDLLLPEMKSRIGELTAAMAEIYASNYTIDEMRQLIAFYETPIGKRMVELAPKVSQLSIMAGRSWGTTVGRDAVTKHADELRRRGIAI